MPTIAPHLAVEITVAAPTVVGSLAVFPLIADRSPSVRYISFAEAVQRGATVKELPGGASVNDLIVNNPLDASVLLYEGEEVLGAQQNRTFDVSALVAARSVLQVPVSCVEAGRWDGARRDESFVPAPQTANPRLRRMKNAQSRASLAAGLEARAVQGEVWREVADTAGRHGVNSGTGAMHDVFERRREQLDAVAQAVEMCCSQVGMLAAIGGRFVVLDNVSEVEAFASLHGPLIQGYALDALEAPDAAPPTIEDARDFLGLLLDAPCTLGPAVGLGDGLRFAFGGLAGTGLVHENEIVTLTAFFDEPGDEERHTGPAVAGRVRRPSRRRPR
ncbi:MAG: ARPP-1 family domain-containing protein [Solirubrobacteraceae bacterium]